jgi:hypothetical protein
MSDHFLAMNQEYSNHYRVTFPDGMKIASDETKTSWPRTIFMKFKNEGIYNSEDDLRFLIRKVNIDYDYNKVTVPDYFTYENMQAQSAGGKRSRRHKKYRRRNKTKHYNRQIKRYTKKYRIF